MRNSRNPKPSTRNRKLTVDLDSPMEVLGTRGTMWTLIPRPSVPNSTAEAALRANLWSAARRQAQCWFVLIQAWGLLKSRLKASKEETNTLGPSAADHVVGCWDLESSSWWRLAWSGLSPFGFGVQSLGV